MIVVCPGIYDEFIHGAVVDYDKAVKTFKNLKFAVLPLIRATVSDIDEALTAIIEGIQHLSRCKALAFVFSGHGDRAHIWAQDGVLQIKQHIVSKLTNVSDLKNSATGNHVAHMPKLFFFDSCRGGKKDAGIQLIKKITTTRPDETYNYLAFNMESQDIPALPTHGNYLIAYSTMRSYVSFASYDGSEWMIKVTEVLSDQQYKQMTITDMLTVANSKVVSSMAREADHIQQPVYISTLRQLLFLHKEGNLLYY